MPPTRNSIEPSTAPAVERRRAQRRPHVVEAWIWSPTSVEEEDRLEVRSVNLSRHGVAFTVPSPVATGTYQTIRFGLGPQSITSEIRVVSCQEESAGTFRIGAQFS